MTIAFLMCVEHGGLEAKGLLLAQSIRRWAGSFAHAEIHSFQPREGTHIEVSTLKALSSLGVQHHTDTLNRSLHDYPIANKVHVCEYAEQTVEADVLCFVDTDTVFVGEPASLDLGGDHEALVRPVDRKRFGSAGENDEHEQYWRRLYELCDVGPRPRVLTTVDQESIRAYFNAGLIVVRRSAGLFSQWMRDFERLLEANHIPPNGMEFLDQMALAATLSRAFERVHIPPPSYNYPLPLRAILPEPWRSAPLSTLTHVHYHQWFNKRDFLRLVRPAFVGSCPQVEWLEQRLPLEPTIDEPMTFRGVEMLDAGSL